jgi:O-antigen ligase
MRSTPAHGLLWLAACLAVVPAALLAVSLPPSATFLNQVAALSGWGVMATVLALGLPQCTDASGRLAWPPIHWGLAALLGALTLLAAACVGSWAWNGLPLSITASNVAFVAAAALLVLLGAATTAAGADGPAFRALCVALLAAGLLSTVVGAVQVFAPGWADGHWIALTALEGRASGNLRQPNHLSSLLLWSLVAGVWLVESGGAADAAPFARPARWRWPLALLALATLIFGLVLSASRTGMVGVLVLAVWGALDRGLSRRARALLLAMPLLYAACWWGLSGWAEASGHVFGGAERLRSESDISSSRFGIWANTLSLIAQHPWAGVGWGEFNLAWSLTPFPHRPVAFFDHTHNLPLQLVVELGMPLGLGVTALLLGALWRAWRATQRMAARDDAARATLLRSAWMMVLLVALHSLLEYPLWYAYFLLPAAFAWGLCLGADRRAGPAAAPARPGWALLCGSLLLSVGGLIAVIDYLSVVAIFEPGEDSAPLPERIVVGQRSVFFAHHADYAAATISPTPAGVLQGVQGARHFLLDTRLMTSWSRALADSGDLERARHIAQRLREFRNPASASFFEPCDTESDASEPLPFQCTPPTRVFGYEDFR